uniref:C-type lectin domain-containing protein n=1 Tax=Sinocyclocheilus rhinocerous TaxID=307959 RepID=A0A673MUX6_9TELE
MTFTGLLLFVLYGLTKNSTGVKVHIHVTASVTCADNFILVQENKTWEEALVYCRSYYTDLASFHFGWPVNQIKSQTNNAQTDSVWTGLRFLNGNWNWLNVINDQNSLPLPSCPPEPHRCGARNTKTERWENRDCEEKLNFLCLYN